MQVKSKSALSAKSAPQKPRRPNKFTSSGRTLLIIIELIALFVALVLILKNNYKSQEDKSERKSKFAEILKRKPATPNLPTPTPTLTPTPTPRPLTLAEMNELYGPCTRVPVLMYHHVQAKEAAEAARQTGLSVYTDIFRSQMQYLKDKGYSVISVSDVADFFDSGKVLPAKSVIITFDDGYRDFYTDAYPVLSEFRYTAVVYLPTGLMQNPGYLSWDEVGAMKGLILFGNHTWSHKSVLVSAKIMQSEISTADTQLAERSLNSPKTFAYPYGPDSGGAKNFISSLGYRSAFTTKPGSILCKKLRLELPRIRIGNAPLSNYGL